MIGTATSTTSPATTGSPSAHAGALRSGLRRQGFAGRLVEPADPDFDAVRAGWNGDVDRRPCAVVLPQDAGDVGAAVRAARRAGVPLTVRGGGHSVAGRSLRDGAVCIDLRRLDAVAVDPATQVVRVGGGALLRDLDAATQRHGLAVPAGQVSHTGVGGLTLGGGLGWLMRRHGLTVDSLLAADVVLADGRSIRASAGEHPDLFWALRGGGGDFGAVTEFAFRAHRVGPTVLAGMLLYPWERAREALAAARTLMDGAPVELTTFAVLLTAPSGDPFPPAMQGRRAVAVGVAWSGEPSAGERVLAPLRRAHPPAMDLVRPMPYVDLQRMLDPTAPPGLRYHDRMHYLPRLGDDLVEALLAGFARVPTPQSHVICGWMGGAIDRVPASATAFGHRGVPAFLWIIGCAGHEPIGPTEAWARGLWQDTRPFGRPGVYLNALDASRPVRDAFADQVWERLRQVKRRYDPDGVFDAHGIGRA